MKSVIEISQLNKKFGSQKVLNGVDINIAPGSVVGLLGNNGAGKTTLLQTMLGFEKADFGYCKLFGEKSPNLSAACKHKIGYVPQEAKLLPWMGINQIIDYTRSFYQHWNDELVADLRAQWELDSNKTIEKLSVGQKQKLAIILALGHSPELLILDEPVASLDPSSRRQFIRQLIDMNIDSGNTILFSTHITSDLERVAADVVILKDGRNYFQGSIDDLKERFIKLYIKSERQLPDDFRVAGMRKKQRIGGYTMLLVEDIARVNLEEIKSNYQATIETEQLSLEDIFVEVHA